MGWLTRLVRRDRLEQQLDVELKFHLDTEMEALVAAGVPAGEARRRATARFGGLEPIKEQARDARGTRWVEDLWHDLRYAGRMMRRNPAFTVAAVVSLAIGIGANAAVFSIAQALLLRPLPIPHPEELVVVNRAGFDDENLRFSYVALGRFTAGVPDARLAAMTPSTRMQVTLGEGATLILGQLVSGEWFDVLGVQAVAGRTLTPEDARTIGGQPVVVLSEAFWTRQFGRDPRIIGTSIRLNDTPLTIVGVAATGFEGVTIGERVDAWVPLTLQQQVRYHGNASVENADEGKAWLPQQGIQWLTVVARIAPPAGRAAVLARIDGVHRQALEQQVASVTDPARRAYLRREHIELLDGTRGLSPLRASFSGPLRVLMATVAVVLLVACANLAGLLLARSAARGREFALRLSLGAKRSRLVRQLLTESVTLACAGGVAALGVAQWGGDALLRLASTGSNPVPLDLAVDWRLLSFTLVVSLATGVLFGLAPALRLSRADLNDALKTGGRVVSGADRIGGVSFGRVLVVAQMALSLALLVGAALFLRTFRNLLAVDTGYERDQVVSAQFDPRLAGFAESQLPALYRRLVDQARLIPGVRTASLALTGAVSGSARTSDIVIEGRARGTGTENNVREDYVAPEYFATMGMTLARGRDFTPRDDERSSLVAVVNETFASHVFGDASPLNHRFGYDVPVDTTIVGVVHDARVDGLRRPVPPMVYYLLSQHPTEFARNLYVRVAGSSATAKVELARAVALADRNLAIRQVVTLAELTERSVSFPKLLSELTGVFALLAVALASLGLYGTVSYSVARRTNELGVRLALGATPGRVRWLVLRETMALVGLGAAAGLLAVLPALKYIGSLLYGLSPRDPATLAVATVILVATGALAGAVPAWRASRVDPLTALRSE